MVRILAIALLMSACSKTNFVRLTTSDESTVKAISELETKVNGVLGCEVIAAKDNDPDGHDRRRISIIRNTKLMREYDDKCLGVYDSWNEQIVYGDEMDRDYEELRRFIVLTHEMGHAFGLEHENDTVMNERFIVMSREEALASLADLMDRHRLNPCTPKEEKQ